MCQKTVAKNLFLVHRQQTCPFNDISFRRVAVDLIKSILPANEKVHRYILTFADYTRYSETALLEIKRLRRLQKRQWICIVIGMAWKSFTILGHSLYRIVSNITTIVVITRPLPRNGGMTENHGAPEPGQLSRTWKPEMIERQRVAKERAPLRVRSWTMQNEMRGVLGRVFAGAGWKILDSTNFSEIKVQQKATSVTMEAREHTVSVTRELNFLNRNRGNLCVKEFKWDSTPPAREKIRVDSRDKRRETTRDYEGQ